MGCAAASACSQVEHHAREAGLEVLDMALQQRVEVESRGLRQAVAIELRRIGAKIRRSQVVGRESNEHQHFAGVPSVNAGRGRAQLSAFRNHLCAGLEADRPGDSLVRRTLAGHHQRVAVLHRCKPRVVAFAA